MRTTALVRFAGLPLGSLLAALGTATHANAATIEVSVVDDQGRPIENVAVYATPAHAVEYTSHDAAAKTAASADAAPTAVMDQKGLQFAPH